MRKTILLALVLSISAPAFAAAPGTAQNFLERANRLKAKGPFAFFDSDYGRECVGLVAKHGMANRFDRC